MNNRDDDTLESVEIIRDSHSVWLPLVKEETTSLLNSLSIDGDSRISVCNEAISIISKCVPSNVSHGQQTGLIVGYVQSGKTLSFTTVAALGRDNKYAIIVIIAGTSKPLTHQSRDRLRRDLRLEIRDDRIWKHIHNPEIRRHDHDQINNILEEWRDPSVSQSERPTILITVMKNHTRLSNLREVFLRVHLEGIPVLFFDDEADQAGLNNLIKQGDESTTYSRLRELKEIVPHHTFLQYTATPQGPLLINIIDVLSPGFAVTLTPGNDYVGGRDIFIDNPNLVMEIPFEDIPSDDNRLTEPPESLLNALRIFFIGVASGYLRNTGCSNRSMMVHPSRKTDPHQQYYNWIISVTNNWKTILNNETDHDYKDLKDEFRESYQNLSLTVEDLEGFEELFSIMHRAIRRTVIHEINAREGHTPDIDWKGAYSNILVGGQALDRGFTVEGLTITYMPRGVGTRQADTIQQRARFFGYKRSYLGYCRVFLERELSLAFTRYVRHEENIRARLIEYRNRPLRELRRAFLVPQGFKPTRESIIDVDYIIKKFSQEWFYPKAPHDSIESIVENRKVVERFLGTLELTLDNGHKDRTEIQKHFFSNNISLSDIYENLLLELRFTRLSDAQNFLGVLVLLQNLLENDFDELCSVYYMSQGKQRERSLDNKGEIPNLFQGAYPVEVSVRGSIYPGDRSIHGGQGITIQIHKLNIIQNDKLIDTNPVYNIAIYIPERLWGDVFLQEQGGA